ncbi:hypothetical protein SLEP1_g38896 [Rubroshorea leprosula]|uniref:Reverse transcriptase Ty1/copia-type domain-containing protein n=1 Tax=Rubroshorea leprosula TaxID=152421 RepID=A0AAV5KYK2_9ROSI|nr:hypothetical protein SLEP1_g38896 [Rubroshorea leprosula]
MEEAQVADIDLETNTNHPDQDHAVRPLRPQGERRVPQRLDDYVCTMPQSVMPMQATSQSTNLEVAALEKNGTWTIETLPPDKRAIDSKWVYKIKFKPDGTVEWYKARLVSKGFTQIEGLDFHETFAPVAKMVTVRTLLALASIKRWELHQLDVNNAFLQGDLHEEVARTTKGILLSQRKYALDILTESGMLGAKPSSFPMEQHHHLKLASGSPIPDPSQYKRLEHFEAAMKVLHYVKHSLRQGILLSSSNHPHLVAYCDADWAGGPRTRRSTTGYDICLRHSPISWQSKKQSIVSHSSTEAEYRAMASIVSELTWLKSLLYDLGIYHSKPMTLFCDNQAALHITNNPVFHARTKHIEIDYHFVCERIQRKELLTAHVPSHCQLADLFTKALGKE